MNELKRLLIRVPDSYYDFVVSMLDEASKSEQKKVGLIDFLKDNPGAMSSDVIKFLVDDLGGYDDYRSSVDNRMAAV